MRKQIASFGTHGRSVRVFVEDFTTDRQALVRCQWREGGKLHTESLPDSPSNRRTVKEYAQGKAAHLQMKGQPKQVRLTMYELGTRYLAAHTVPDVWRAKTLKTFLSRWKVWITFATPDRLIDTVEPTTLDDFRTAMKDQKYAVNQIANHVQMVKSVYLWARERRLLAENPIAGYRMKLSRDARRLKVAEWSNDECAAIIEQLSPKDSRRWRAHVAIVLDAVLGARSNALLNLEWRDVDLASRYLHWRPELDKLGKDRWQPLPRAAVRALRIAKVWRKRIGYEGPFVIPAVSKAGRGIVRELREWEKDPKHKRVGKNGSRAVRDRAYSYQALRDSLKSAAEEAGLKWIDYRAMHSFRRMVVNNVLALTGNITLAGKWIGDDDIRTLQRSYVRERQEELRDVANAVELPGRNRTATESKKEPLNVR